jgi:hypothetical protein
MYLKYEGRCLCDSLVFQMVNLIVESYVSQLIVYLVDQSAFR